MATAGDIVTTALQNLGVIALEEQPTAAESQNGLNALNTMLDVWNTESLLIYNVEPEVFPFIANKQSYTIGPGGDFNTARPVKIERAYSRSSGNIDLPIEVVDYDFYADITAKTITSTIPLYLYDNGDFPLKTLFFWPIPSDTSYSAVLWNWKQISSFTSLSTTVVLPPGYQAALEFNLSGWLAPRMGKAVSNDIASLAASTKAQIKRLNYLIQEVNFRSSLTNQNLPLDKATFLSGVF